jgi:CHAD domain-containing protein
MSSSLVSVKPPDSNMPAAVAPVAAANSPDAPGEPATASRRRRLAGALLKDKTNTLFRHFPGALAGDEEAIHQLRVSGRRLRVALRLLAEKPNGRRAARAQRRLRLLTQTAGSARDLDVLLETFAERLKQLPRRSPEQKRLRHRLADARRRGRARMVQCLLDAEISRLRGDLATLASRGGPERTVICQRIRVMCERESRKLLDGFAALGALLDIKALHALRRRARRLRYAVEVFAEIFGAAAGVTKPWRSLQDLIGTVHDHNVLAEWFDRQARADERRGNSGLAAAAVAEATWTRETMRQLHDRFLAEDPSALVHRGLAAVGFLPAPGSR